MRKGFTLIELMIVIAIIAIIAAIAIPNLLESRVTANESAASASLKSGVFPAQTQFTGGTYQDADGNGQGEFGTLAALSGDIPCTGINENQLTLVTGPLANGAGSDTVRVSSNFNFLTVVPGDDTVGGDNTIEGEGLPGAPAGADADDPAAVAVAANPDYRTATQQFIVGAAPLRYGDSGRRVFLLNNTGQVYSPTNLDDVAAWFSDGAGAALGAAAVGTDLDDRPTSIDLSILYGMGDAYGVAGVQSGAGTPADLTADDIGSLTLDTDAYIVLSR